WRAESAFHRLGMCSILGDEPEADDRQASLQGAAARGELLPPHQAVPEGGDAFREAVAELPVFRPARERARAPALNAPLSFGRAPLVGVNARHFGAMFTSGRDRPKHVVETGEDILV